MLGEWSGHLSSKLITWWPRTVLSKGIPFATPSNPQESLYSLLLWMSKRTHHWFFMISILRSRNHPLEQELKILYKYIMYTLLCKNDTIWDSDSIGLVTPPSWHYVPKLMASQHKCNDHHSSPPSRICTQRSYSSANLALKTTCVHCLGSSLSNRPAAAWYVKHKLSGVCTWHGGNLWQQDNPPFPEASFHSISPWSHIAFPSCPVG